MKAILKSLRVTLLLVVAIVVAVAGASIISASSSADPGPPPGWSADDWADLSSQDQTIEMTDFDDGTGNSTEKAAWVDSNSEDTVDAENSASMYEDGTPSDTSTGVLETSDSPFGAKYAFENQWQGFSADGQKLIQVYAGDLTASPCSGVLVINELPADGADDAEVGTVTELPGRGDGTLFITGEEGGVVHFSDDVGDGSYNVETHAFYWCPPHVPCAEPPPPLCGAS